MAQPEKSFEYKGYQVEIDTFSVSKKVGWQYTIDGKGPYTMGDSACVTEDRAISEAWFDARNRIEKMPAK